MEGWMDGITGVFEESDELFKEHVCFFFCANGHLYVYHRDEKLYLSMYVYDELMHPNHVPFRHVRNQAKSMSTPKTSLKAQS